MEYGHFLEGGSKYEIVTPFTPSPWTNALFNDEYHLETDQMLQGEGQLVKNYNRAACIQKERYFYLMDRKSGEVWNPNITPLGKSCDSYSCIHGLWDTRLTSARLGIESSISVMVPVSGSREIWSVSLRNQSDEERELSLYTMFGFYDHGVMGGECVYDRESQVIVKYAFPYHTLYEEKQKVEKEKAYVYLFSDRRPDSCDMSQRRFFGNQGRMGIPQGIRNGALSGKDGEAEDFCGAFAYNLNLKPGETCQLFLETGAAVTREEILHRKECFGKEYVERERSKVQNTWDEVTRDFYMETPDCNLNAFGNYWLKKQITLLTRQNRGSSYCPIRNQLQDAMGYAMVDPVKAEPYIWDAMRLQRQDGFVRQWHDTTGAPPRGLCLLHHTDGPVWLVICTELVIRQIGAKELWLKKIPYQDGGEGTVLEHLTRALRYLYKNVGPHGMCLIGDGDWNDPINGVGREGKGESVWLSMALVYATRLMLTHLAEDADRTRELTQALEHMKQSINTYAWCGKWYAAAIHDDGNPIGDTKDRLFLNTQSWAILADVVDEQRRRILEESLKQLDTPFGPLILFPPFRTWDERWGRISVKKAGTTENGSVYNHASMFLAYARAKQRNADDLYRILWQTLPTNPENDAETSLQIPIYLSNYYFGLRESDNYGRSSRHYGTGSAAWMQMLIVEELLGLQAGEDGICLHPLLPSEWEQVRCTRRFKNATYHVTIKRSEAPSVYVDGQLYEREVLPYQDGKDYGVEVFIV